MVIMNQAQRIDFLLEYLIEELPAQSAPGIPNNYKDKRRLFRALVNIRAPHPISEDFLSVQDAFLKEEAWQKGIIALESIPPCGQDDRLALWQGDITRLAVDAIVNAANSEMLGCFVPGHHCIDNAIHTAAGVQLRETCHAIMALQGRPEEPGLAKVTQGYNLPARHIIHTVGPQAEGRPTARQKAQLAECYKACMDAAVANGIRSLALCCISTGVFAFPKELAAQIATHTVRRCLEKGKCIERVIFVVFTDEDRAIYASLLGNGCNTLGFELLPS
jgi:O-acetyl-ADP-ribose deacetylase (regulator of RNase III)